MEPGQESLRVFPARTPSKAPGFVGSGDALMHDLSQQNLGPYLESLLGKPVKILGLAPLGQPLQAGLVKGYGYGVPIQVEYEASGLRHRAVMETISPGPFGHEHMADRAQVLLWSHSAFNRLPP